MTKDPASWWREATVSAGITQALDLEPLYQARSAFQEIGVYEHPIFGRVLTLDGTVQLAVADEFIYHELAVHVALNGRPWSAARVLIIGGGDGGILREVLRHECVAEAWMVEIDPDVLDVSRRFLKIEGDIEDPRVRLRFEDGVRFMAECAAAGRQFDVIIVDATDSTSPSKVLWSEGFYGDLRACLAPGGVAVDSDILLGGAGPVWMSRDPCDIRAPALLADPRWFARVDLYLSRQPLYPGGWFAFFLYQSDTASFRRPVRDLAGRFYSPAVHEAVFVLPAWGEALRGEPAAPAESRAP